jgi:hypothetical protein
MNNKIIQISGFTIEDFLSMLDEKINQALEKFQSSTNNAIPEKEFYTRDEVAKLLNISFGTFIMEKKGILEPVKIGNRVYYPKIEVFSKLKLAS